MSDELQVINTPIDQSPTPFDGQSVDQLAEQIVAAQNKVLSGDQTPIGQVQAPNTTQQTPTNTAPVGQVNSQQTSNPVAETNNKVEPPTNATTFEELQKKSGVPNADVLASNYLELQRELSRKAQELAGLKKTQYVPSPGIPEQNNNVASQPQVDVNEMFLKDLSMDPLGTIARVVSSITESKTKPLFESERNNALKSEITGLAIHPEQGRLFNMPEVQAELKALCNENPSYIQPGEFSKAFRMAVGNVAIKNSLAGASQPSQAAVVNGNRAFVEGANKPTQTQPFTPQTASMSDLESVIKSLLPK